MLEHRYAAVLLASLLTEDSLDELGDPTLVPVEIKLQASQFSWVDDMLITARPREGGEELQAAIGVRRDPDVVPSDEPTVKLVGSYLREVIERWSEIEAGRFRLVLAVTDHSLHGNQLARLAQIASGRGPEQFRAEAGRSGPTDRKTRDRLIALDKVVAEAARRVAGASCAVKVPEMPTQELTWRLLRGLTVRRLRLEVGDEQDRTHAVNRLRNVAAENTARAAEELMSRIEHLVGDWAPSGAHVTADELRMKLAARLKRDSDASAPALARYLEAAGRAARSHPYAGVLLDMAPPLTDVYVRQQALSRTLSHADADQLPTTAAAPLSADEIMVRGETCVVFAGPGGGKSSLLRTHLAETLERVQAGEKVSAIPVLISAADLAEDVLPNALARAVTSELSNYGLVEELPPKLFIDQPLPDVSWLVLVDGLDEIIDAKTRNQVLGKLTAVIRGENGSQYRFIVATRPLPDGELDRLGKVPRHELQRFSSEDLHQFVRNWFHALELPEADRAADEFTKALGRFHLTGLARNPLMAAMLCQLHAKHPDRFLPTGRGEIYRRFLDLLTEHRHASGIVTRTRASLEAYGKDAIAQADTTLSSLQSLIDLLAARRSEDKDTPAVAFLAAQSEAERPEGVPQPVWERFLGNVLRGSGLLIERADRFEFLHQTLLEYCAVNHATRDAQARAQTLRAVFHLRWYGRRPWIYVRRIRSHVWWEEMARRLSHRSSLGFLLDAVPDTREVRRLLKRVISIGGVQGCDVIAGQAELGTRIPVPITEAAVSLLENVARDATNDGWDRVNAARILYSLDDLRGVDLLVALARDTAVGLDPERLDAEFEDEESLVDMSDDRVWAAECLVEFGDARGADLLYELGLDPSLHGLFRQGCADRLEHYGDARAADLLMHLARDTTVRTGARVAAAGRLARLEPRRGTALLRDLSQDPGADRLFAVWALSRLDETSFADLAELLVGLANDASVPQRDRIQAHQWLTQGCVGDIHST
ncbi:NACHT domain-containing protein [Streptomyces sp. NPDC013978]|uniref:NACHT domain-containing protein n=1 Tax=Streptomyces sp. NPDC013978 TaxID=3364869 RepID=UPI0037003368